MPEQNISDIKVGVVGLGLMGSSIITNFLISGHPVVGIAPIAEDYETGKSRIGGHLQQCHVLNLLKKDQSYYLSKLHISSEYTDLQDCAIVLECVIENEQIKAQVFRLIEKHVSSEAVIGTNTSAIPISTLQSYLNIPSRLIGMHWAEPAYASRFLEIICGNQTDLKFAEKTYQLAHYWGKEPTLVRKDIRGFITNRLMYAVYREGLSLAENGSASLEDLDKSFRYDAGSWITIMGIFQRMDYEGLDQYADTIRAIFPELSTMEIVPEMMKKIVAEHGKGIYNLAGLYPYTENEAKHWEESFARFSKEIYQLATLYLDPKP